MKPAQAFTLISLLCMLSNPTLAADSCPATFAQLPKEEDQFIRLNKDSVKQAETSRDTVEIVGSMPGKHGGKLYIAQKKNPADAWSSFYRGDTDIPSDPRTFALIGKEKMTHYFGFRKIDAEKVTVPNHAEMNAAIDKVNKELVKMGKEPIPIHFYAGNKLVTAKKYSNEWANHLRIPIDEPDLLHVPTDPKMLKGHLTIHDANHTAAIFLPPSLVKHSRLHTQRELEFVNFLEAQAQKDPSLRDFVTAIDPKALILDSATGNIDAGTGNVAFLKRTQFLDPKNAPKAKKAK